MPSYRRIRQAVARSRVEDVRLGLRLTARQTEEKSTDKGEDKPADGADGPADSGVTDQDKPGLTVSNPADGATAAADGTEDELVDRGAAGLDEGDTAGVGAGPAQPLRPGPRTGWPM